jgi:hypothetical protein
MAILGGGLRKGRVLSAAAKDGLTAAERAARNFAKGKVAEEIAGKNLEAEGMQVGKQLTVKTKSGLKTRIDFVTRDPETGAMECVECKASDTAPLSRGQKPAFPEIERSGGIIVGKGKPGFPGGTDIPAGEVRVIRNPKKDAQ